MKNLTIILEGATEQQRQIIAETFRRPSGELRKYVCDNASIIFIHSLYDITYTSDFAYINREKDGDVFSYEVLFASQFIAKYCKRKITFPKNPTKASKSNSAAK